MKPAQEQVIAWARGVGFSEYHLRVLDQGIYRLADLAYEAGRKDENEACAKVLDEMAAKDRLSNYYKVAAIAIRARREQ